MMWNDEIDDGSLLAQFCDTRCDAAFSGLVRRHLPLVFGVARRRLGSAALAEEAAQMTFARLAAKASEVARNPERLAAWLHRTAYYEASSLARREARLSRVPIEATPASMDRPELHERLDEALARLDETDREVVLRHCCAGEDYRRIAAAVGLSPAACQKRMERALDRLARLLDRPNPAKWLTSAFAATSAKGEALPAAESIASTALESQTAASAAGAASGMKIAVCLSLTVAGGIAGWQPRENHAVVAPAEISQAESRMGGTSSSAAKAGAREASASPRPMPVSRTRDEVLESIQAGRLGPLLEFLPQTTVADLRAIIAEDDTASRGEGSWMFGAAHGLAMRRWTEIEPESALRYAIQRDQEGVISGELSSAVMAVWMRIDFPAASKAFLSLPVPDRLWIVRHIAEPQIGDHLLALDPALNTLIGDRRPGPEPELTLKEAERMVAACLAGTMDTDDDKEISKLVKAFLRLGAADLPDALAKAGHIPAMELRPSVTHLLHHTYSTDPDGVPPGPLRTALVRRQAERRMPEEPEAVIRQWRCTADGAERDALLEVISRSLAGRDPWRLLQIHQDARGTGPLPEDALVSALQYAGRTDPQRALRMLAGLSVHGEPGKTADALLQGWLQRDPGAAMQWAVETGIAIDPGEIAGQVADPQVLIECLKNGSPEVREMARSALIWHVPADGAMNEVRPILNQLAPSDAQHLLYQLAMDACCRGDFARSLQIAAEVPPDVRAGKFLPWMAMRTLRQQTAEGRAWLKSLPAADRQAIVGGLRAWLDGEGRNTDDRGEILNFLEQIRP